MKPFNAFVLLLLLIINQLACRQDKAEPPFWSEIQKFKESDRKQLPPKDGILFIGSSSFRLWTELEAVFREYNAINRGFGGATLLDAKRYANEIIFPYQPRQIVIYCGENDLPADTVTAEMLLKRFKEFFSTIRSRMPETPIVYISIKPSPARKKYIPLIIKCNTLIKNYLNSQPNTEFINIFPLLLTKDGRLRPELYVEDRSHMNKEGYRIWAEAIRPYLIR